MGVAVLKFQFSGNLLSGADNWSTGFNCPVAGAPTVADLNAMALGALIYFRDQYWTSVAVQVLIHPSTSLRTCKVSWVDASGLTLVVGQADLAVPAVGTSPTVPLPSECAIVCSLRTGVAGARGRGRMYLPGFAVNVMSSTGFLVVGSQTAILQRMQIFFDDFNADVTLPRAGVATQVGSAVNPITSIQVGSVVDSQRRRRNGYPEVYQSAVLAP